MAYSSHFAACLHAHDSRWETFMVCNPDGSPAVPGLAHYSAASTFTDARLLAEAMVVRAQRDARVSPTPVVWVEGESPTNPHYYESTTVAPCGQLSLLDYRNTPNTVTC